MWRGLALAMVVSGCLKLPTGPLLFDEGGARRGLAPAAEAQPLEFSVNRFPEGTRYSLSQDRGSVVLLDVWATWCDPCRDTLPFYDDVHRQFSARGLKVYAISVDADPALIGPFLQDLKVSLPVLHDPEAGVTAAALKVRQMPSSYLVDRKGKLRRVHEGLSDDFFQQTLSEVEALLSEP